MRKQHSWRGYLIMPLVLLIGLSACEVVPSAVEQGTASTQPTAGSAPLAGTATTPSTAPSQAATTIPEPLATLAPLPVINRAAANSLADTIVYRKDQKLECGVNGKLRGFSLKSGPGDNDYAGVDVEFCKAVAIAIFGEFANKVRFHPNSENNFQAVRDGQVDVVFANTPATYNRDIGEGVDFGPATFHDEQWVLGSAGMNNVDQLKDKNVCSASNTISRLNLTDLQGQLGFTPVLTDTAGKGFTLDTAFDVYLNGGCDALTGARSELAIKLFDLQSDRDGRILFPLPETLRSREPWSPFYRENDGRWAEVIHSVVNCTIAAEELGVTRNNVKSQGATTDTRIKRLLGQQGYRLSSNNPALLPDFCRRIIEQVGNYEDIYNGQLSNILGADRGPNKAWNNGQGGVLAAPPPR
jgi:general L-amino acid transport system substrate-binding protein